MYIFISWAILNRLQIFPYWYNSNILVDVFCYLHELRKPQCNNTQVMNIAQGLKVPELFLLRWKHTRWNTLLFILIKNALLTFNLSPEIGGNCGRLRTTVSSVSMSAPSCSRFRFWLFLDFTVVKESVLSVISTISPPGVVDVLSVSIAKSILSRTKRPKLVRTTDTEAWGYPRVAGRTQAMTWLTPVHRKYFFSVLYQIYMSYWVSEFLYICKELLYVVCLFQTHNLFT